VRRRCFGGWRVGRGGRGWGPALVVFSVKRVKREKRCVYVSGKVKRNVVHESPYSTSNNAACEIEIERGKKGKVAIMYRGVSPARRPKDQIVGLDGQVEQGGVLARGDGGLGGGTGGGGHARGGVSGREDGLAPHEPAIQRQVVSILFPAADADAASQHCEQGPKACVVGGVGGGWVVVG